MDAHPFPGVDPRLESPDLWGDFHHEFLGTIRAAIADQLPGPYLARLKKRVQLVELPTEEDEKVRDFRPDVSVLRDDAGPNEGGLSVPVELPIYEEERTYMIGLHHGDDWELVTALELLSPINKVGEGRRQYLTKRNDVLNQFVHLVEIDLLLGGVRLPLLGTVPSAPFGVVASTWEDRPNGVGWFWGLDEPLPSVNVPLKSPDPPIVLDLQATYLEAHRHGRFSRLAERTQLTELPLSRERREWAQKLLRNAP